MDNAGLKQSLKTYFQNWQAWCREAKSFGFAELKPMHAGWKVADETALGAQVAEWLPLTEQGHIGSVDGRKIVLLALKEPLEGVPVIQVMQLRPGSSDPLGFDHVAFYCPNMAELEDVLKSSSYQWEHQSNPGHAWISLWFGDNKREVKFFDHTSLDLGAHELSEASVAIKAGAN